MKIFLCFVIHERVALLEYWDLYDKNRKPLNKIHQRGIPLNDGEYHIVVCVITINSKNELLLTHRDPSKEIHPDLWEITAGSAISGETSINAAARELFEETGIDVSEDELIMLDTVVGNTKGRFAFVDIYMIKKDIEIDKLKMQPGETTEAKWVTSSQFKEMAKKGEIAESAIKRLSIVKDLIKNLLRAYG